MDRRANTLNILNFHPCNFFFLGRAARGGDRKEKWAHKLSFFFLPFSSFSFFFFAGMLHLYSRPPHPTGRCSYRRPSPWATVTVTMATCCPATSRTVCQGRCPDPGIFLGEERGGFSFLLSLPSSKTKHTQHRHTTPGMAIMRDLGKVGRTCR